MYVKLCIAEIFGNVILVIYLQKIMQLRICVTAEMLQGNGTTML